MKKIFAVAAFILAFTICAPAQTTNTFNARQFKGDDQGAKITKAQQACNPTSTYPCVIILDPELANFATGSIPTRCTQCVWIDYRTPGTIGYSASSLGPLSTGGLLALNAGGTLNAFGDSITVGQGATIPASGGYAALVSASLGMVINNQAVSGTQAQDSGQIDKIYTTAITQNSASLWLPAFNDMRLNGVGGQPIATVKNTILAGAIHAAIPDSYRVAGTAAGCVKTGTWATNTGVYNNLSVFSTTNGDTVSCANIRGSTIYVTSIAATAGGGQLTVKVDGTQYGGTYNLFSYATSNAGRTYSPFVIRIPNLTSGPHTVLVTVASATNAANSVNVVEVAGSGGGNNYQGPNVYLGEVAHMTTAGYALAAPFNAGSDNAVDAYNAAILDVCSQLTRDGLGVVCVDTSRFNPTLDDSADNIHPSDQGHQHLADAFLAAINSASIAPNKGASALETSRRSYLPLYSPLPNNFGLISACPDANNCQIAANRDPVNGLNLNPALLGGAINFGSDGNIDFYSTAAGLAPGVTKGMRITPAGQVQELLFGSQTNCNASAGACTAAPTGVVSIAAAATTITVATTAVTATSQVFVQEMSSLGGRMGLTCNTTTGRTYTVTALTAGTSFVITASAAPVTNPACLAYFIVN